MNTPMALNVLFCMKTFAVARSLTCAVEHMREIKIRYFFNTNIRIRVFSCQQISLRDKALAVFNSVQKPTVHMYSAVIKAVLCTISADSLEIAKSLLVRMESQGLRPSISILTTMISAYTKNKEYSKAEDVIERITADFGSFIFMF